MGIIISTTNYAPFSLVTGIIGLVSFLFTLGTFFKVLWTNFETLGEAPHEIHAYLTTLRTELLEEKSSIKIMRKQRRKYIRKDGKGEFGEGAIGIELDEVSLKTLGDSVKALVKRFKELERPFLEEGEQGIAAAEGGNHNRQRRKRRSESPYYQHSAYAPPSPAEKRRSVTAEDDRDADEDLFWAERTEYAHMTMKRRWIWLRKKSEAQNLTQMLTRVQVRRIARQVGGMSVVMHEYGGCTMDVREGLRRIEDRMNRIVGVRRVD